MAISRNSERYDTFESATVEVYGRSSDFRGIMKNLSKTGAMFQAPESRTVVRKGDFVRITISLEELSRTHTLNGQVVWESGTEFGVSFLSESQLFSRMMQKSVN